MKKFKLLSLLLIITLFVGAMPIPAVALDYPEVGAQAAVVMDADTGEYLFDKNGSMSLEPGALGLLMTCLLVGDAVLRQDLKLEDVVTASETFRSHLAEGSVVLNPALVPGEKMTLKDLLYSTLFPSAEDAANMMAEYVAGSVDNFIASMNQRAAELGCADTHFVTASGMMASGQRSTAKDIAIIANEAFSNISVSTATQEMTYTVAATEAAGARYLNNPNRLFDPQSEYYNKDVYGGKTATTDLGCCVVVGASYNDIDVIVVVMGCPDDAGRFNDANTLLNWVFNNYSYRQILSATDNLDTLPVELGSPESVGVRAETPLSKLLPNEEELGNIEYTIEYAHEQTGTPLKAPVNAGEYLGTVTVYMDGQEYGSSRQVAASTVDISRVEYLRSQLKTLPNTPAVRQIVTILIVIFAIYLLLVLFYLIQRLRHLHSMRRARKDRAIARSQQEVQWLEIPDDRDQGPAAFIEEPADEDGEEEEDDYAPAHDGGEGYHE